MSSGNIEVWVGQTVKPGMRFSDGTTGEPVDPDTVICRTCSPEGTFTSYVYGTDAELTRTSTGFYEMAVQTTEEGRIGVRWEGWITGISGTSTGVQEGYIICKDSPFPYVPLVVPT